MEEYVSYATVAIWIVWTIIVLVIYHKVTDYRLGQGLFKELFFAALLGGIMAGLTLMFWPLTVAIILLCGFLIKMKTSNGAAFIGCIILAVVIAFTGIKARKISESEESSNIDYVQEAHDPNNNLMEDREAYDSDDEIMDVYDDYQDYGSDTEYQDYEDEIEQYDDSEYIQDYEDEITQYDDSEYILENSSSQYLTKTDLEGFSADDCRLARNELYARHGRKFDSEDLQAYFDSCSWYQGTIEPGDFQESMLNDIEIANRDLIVEYEEEMGYR